MRRWIVVLMVCLVAAGCGGSTSVGGAPADIANGSGDQAGAEAAEPTAPSAPTTGPAADDGSDPTGGDAGAGDSGGVSGGVGRDFAGDPPSFEGAPPRFLAEALYGFSADAGYLYAASTMAWLDPTPCDAAPAQALAGLAVDDVLPALAGDPAVEATIADPAGFAVGLHQSGDVQQLLFSPGGLAAFTSSCGPLDGTRRQWLQTASFDSAGRIAALGPRLPLEVDANGEAAWLYGWYDESSVRMREIIEGASDESFDDWFIEDRVVSIETGETVSAERTPYLENIVVTDSPAYTSPDGRFTYREVADPGGSLGCEGFGEATTIEVDDGSGPQLALGDDGPTFSTVENLQFGPDGLIAWTSGCEGYSSAYLGRIDDGDGRILDAHGIDTYAVTGPTDRYVDYRFYRLAADGSLVGAGTAYLDSGDGELAVFRYDLARDPQFVETAARPPSVDRTNPLAPTLQGGGNWYVGDTLASEPACGASTMYGDTSTGLARAFATGTELDTIVDFAASEPLTVTYPEGGSYTSRSIAVLTECPEAYEGRRIWFGVEPDKVRFGLYLQQADFPEVADLLSVRDYVAPGTDYVESTFAEVVLLDGTVTEIELVPVPYEG